MAKKKINQNDLRQLMRKRCEDLNKKDEKIESSLAKYNSLGRLSCILCNVEIGANVPWRHHILSRSHKENIKLKRKLSDADNVSSSVFAKKTKTLSTGVKDVSLNGKSLNESDAKRLKEELPKSGKGLVQAYSSSDDDDDDDGGGEPAQSQCKESLKPPTTSVLPPDFFDVPPSTTTESVLCSTSKNAPTIEAKGALVKEHLTASNVLPEGFFDDPVLDAKARNVEYKDPKEEEWEKFQKTIAEETTVSQNIIEEDAEEREVNKNIDEIDEQINNWQKVEELHSKHDEILKKVDLTTSSAEQESSDISMDEDDVDFFLDWRAKDLWEK